MSTLCTIQSQMLRRGDVARHPEALWGSPLYICTYFCTWPPPSCKGFPDLMQKLRSPHIVFKLLLCIPRIIRMREKGGPQLPLLLSRSKKS